MSQHSQTALALVRQAFNESPQSAERQLAVIGNTQGDEALTLVAQELLPAEVFALAREGDPAKHSLAQAFVTPEQLTQAFSYFGSKYRGPTNEVARDLLDFLHPFFFEGEMRRRRDMVGGFLEHDLSIRALCALCVGNHGFLEFFSRDRFEALKGEEGWQELILFVREVNPRAFATVREHALGMAIEGKEDGGRAYEYCRAVSRSLIKEARQITGDGEGKDDSKSDVFGDI